MDVLIVGADNPAGVALQQALAQWGRHRVTALTGAAGRWRSERQAKKAARKGGPQAIVDLRIAWQVASGEGVQELDIERSHWLAKACARSDMHYLLLSSDRVFGGVGGRSLRETDPPDVSDGIGGSLADMERRVLQTAPNAVVLRTGPLFASSQANLLTRTLAAMREDRSATFDDREIFCPVASPDVARVMAAILDQLSVGAPAAGIYHYCSGDRTTEYGFAEASLAAASQYQDCGDIVISQEPGAADAPVRQRVLECSRLRDAFAIKQVPWRGFINILVRQYMHMQQAQTPAPRNQEV